MARRVDERDHVVAAQLHVERRDRLRDPSSFVRSHRRLAQPVQKRRFPVVHVAHNRDYRRASGEVVGRGLHVGRLEVEAVVHLDFDVQIHREKLDRVGGDQIVFRAERRFGIGLVVFEALDALFDGDSEELRDVQNGEIVCDRQNLFRFRLRFGLRSRI